MIVAVALVLVGAACSSGESVFPTTSATPSTENAENNLPIDSEAVEAGETIVDRLGADDGFAAVVLALDRGYDVGQVVNGAGTVTPDGTIPDVTPSGPAYGLFAESADALGGAVILAAGPTDLDAAGGEITIEDLGRALERDFDAGAFLTNPSPAEPVTLEEREMAEAFIGSILALVDIGYSFDQVVEGLIFGELRFGVATDPRYPPEEYRGERKECVVLAANADLAIITPKSDPGYSFNSTLNCRDGINDGKMKVLVQGKFIDSPTSTTTTTADVETEAPAETTNELPVNGLYVGTATSTGSMRNLVVLESHVEITISGGQAEIISDMTVDGGLEYDGGGGVLCSSIARMVYSGVGTAGMTIEIPTTQQSVEILSVTGECEDTPLYHWTDQAGESYSFTGTYSAGTITGTHILGIIAITATRVP